MMKRRISTLMILLANMLILAHAVVPHHHHNKVFVAIVNILDHDAQDIFNHEHGHEHHHDGGSDHTAALQQAEPLLKVIRNYKISTRENYMKESGLNPDRREAAEA